MRETTLGVLKYEETLAPLTDALNFTLGWASEGTQKSAGDARRGTYFVG